MLVLALESSTSSAKAVVYDSEKGFLRERQEPFDKSVSSGGKSDPEAVFNLMIHNGSLAAAGYDIQAVALCSIWQSICAADENYHPVTQVYSWNFQDTSPLCEEIRKNETLTNDFYSRTGCMVSSIYPRFVLPYLREKGINLSNKKFMSQGGYHFFRMTGEFLESGCTQSGAGFINLETMKYDDFILDYCGVHENQFGELASFDDVRPLKEDIARMLKIPSGIPVVPAYADGALNQVGSNANRPGVMTISVGTSAALRVAAEKPDLPDSRHLWCYLGVGKKYIKGGAISGACNCINWYKDTMLGGHFSFAELEKKTGNPLPGFLPFLYGERCPGWQDGRAAEFTGVRFFHQPADFYQSIQLGITFNMHQCYNDICENAGEPESIIVSGGITHSVPWCQMLADVLGRQIRVSGNSSASTMGAAALALHAAGCLEDVTEFREDSEDAGMITPNPENAEYYKIKFLEYLDHYRNRQ